MTHNMYKPLLLFCTSQNDHFLGPAQKCSVGHGRARNSDGRRRHEPERWTAAAGLFGTSYSQTQ